jgi:hypothetical protein
MNREEGFCLSKSWKPLICTLKYPRKWTASHTSWVLLNTLQYRVPLHEDSSPPLPLPLPLWLPHTHCHYYTQNTVILHPHPHSSNLGLSTTSLLGSVSYEFVPIQEPTSLCNQLALVHPEDGGDTILRNVGSYKSHTASSPRRW